MPRLLLATGTPWYALTATIAGYLLTLVLIRWALLLKKEQPSSTVAWIMAIVFIPVVGGVLFLLFGVNRVDRRRVAKSAKDLAIRRQLPGIAMYQILPDELDEDLPRDVARLANHVGRNLLTAGNDIQVFTDTHETFGLIEQAIGAAQETIHLEYYIWQRDKTGTHLRDLVVKKAREGVKVRFLYDGIGSLYLNNRFLKPMRDAGVEVAGFLPGASFRERWSVNLRNHRKIVVVDGRVGFTGGMNIGDEYLGLSANRGYWRDTHLRVEGPCALQLQQTFAEDWFYATNEALTDLALYPDANEPGSMIAQVIASGPTGRHNTTCFVMFEAINQARYTIQLTTGYFVPPSELCQALATAALRGVRVEVLVPGRSSYLWTIFAGRSYYEVLLDAGVEIHEYQRGALHAKTLCVDGQWSLVGGANFDSRSTALNFEVGLGIASRNIAHQLAEQFTADLDDSMRIEPATWGDRSGWRQFSEDIFRLFSPIF